MYQGYKLLPLFFLFSCTGSILDTPIDIMNCSGYVTIQELKQRGFSVSSIDQKGFIVIKDQANFKILDMIIKGSFYSEVDEKLHIRSFSATIDTSEAKSLLRKFRSSHFVLNYPLSNDSELFHSRELSAILILSPNTSKAIIKKFL